jgi:hypothetical protein
MKRKIIPILAAVMLVAILFSPSCKKTDAGTSTLTVLVTEGVTGIPEAGVYNLVTGDQLQYSFSLKAGYSKLTVLLDGAAIAASGTLTLSADHTLKAYADDNFQYGLTVTVSAGVNGTPKLGTFTYAPGSLVDYSYTLADGYSDLVVKLDGTVVDSSGTVTMSADHTLSASAEAGKNILGSWLLAETYNDGSSFNVSAAFSGNYTGGTVTDSDGGSGTYTFTAAIVAFNLIFPEVTYEYSGSFSDNDTMSGTCKRYQSSASVISGTWTATRKTSAAAALWRNASAGDRSRKGDAPQSKKN